MLGLRLDDKFRGIRQLGARRALNILSAINLINFADRYVPSAVKTLIEADLKINDFQSSLPTTGMIIVYMIFAMIFGILSDKQLMDRRIILCGAIIFWSIATALAGLSKNLVQLVALRSLVGVGEAAYGTIAPPMISDYFTVEERNTAYGIYYLAIPVGGALGYGIGAILGSTFSWRVAFLGIGIPGIVIAVLVLTINDPVRGINDAEDTLENSTKTSAHLNSGDANWKTEMKILWSEILVILKNKHFMAALLGSCANNFALGGLSEWYATFLLRYTNASLDTAGLLVGAITIVAGIGGTVLGTKVADYFLLRVKSSYFLIPALFTIPAAFLLLLAINITDLLWLEVLLLLFAQICAWTCIAPISAVAISVIPPRLRSRSAGILIFGQHILGDIFSPPLIGAISDQTHSLRTGLQMCWIAILVSGIWWWAGYFFLSPLSTDMNSELVAGESSSSSSSSCQGGCTDAKVSDGETSHRTYGTAAATTNGLGVDVVEKGPDELHEHELHDASTAPESTASASDDKTDTGVGYCSLLCGKDPLTMNEQGQVVFTDDPDGSKQRRHEERFARVPRGVTADGSEYSGGVEVGIESVSGRTSVAIDPPEDGGPNGEGKDGDNAGTALLVHACN